MRWESRKSQNQCILALSITILWFRTRNSNFHTEIRIRIASHYKLGKDDKKRSKIGRHLLAFQNKRLSLHRSRKSTPRNPAKWCGFSVEQPRETVPFAKIQPKEIQPLNRIVRFLVVPHKRPDFRLKSGLFVFPYCSRRQKESGATGIPHHRATLRNNIPGSEHRIMAATQTTGKQA